MPAHQLDLLMGMRAGIPALGSPRICERRKKPVSGSCCILTCSIPDESNETILLVSELSVTKESHSFLRHPRLIGVELNIALGVLQD